MANHLIKLNDKQFRLYIPHSELQQAIEKIARKINADMEGKNPLFICVLNGAFIFAADLLKEISVDCEITFMRMKTYEGLHSSGRIKEIQPLEVDIKNRTVIIVEDIVDTGFTICRIKEYLSDLSPKEVKVATMFFKPDVLKCDLTLDYVAREVDNKFIVGYGLDYDEKGRNLKDLYILNEQ